MFFSKFPALSLWKLLGGYRLVLLIIIHCSTHTWIASDVCLLFVIERWTWKIFFWTDADWQGIWMHFIGWLLVGSGDLDTELRSIKMQLSFSARSNSSSSLPFRIYLHLNLHFMSGVANAYWLQGVTWTNTKILVWHGMVLFSGIRWDKVIWSLLLWVLRNYFFVWIRYFF